MAFFPSVDAAGRLSALRMTPFQIRKMRLNRPEPEDVRWLASTRTRVSAPFGSRIEADPDGSLVLR